MMIAIGVFLTFGPLIACLAYMAFSAGRGSAVRREQRRVYGERDDAIADIVAMRREAEHRMLRITREEADVIDGTVADSE